MALLGATSLTGCNKIPKFIDSGSKMIFYMATVPVSWTKDTSPNETMCRITNSTLSPGGSLTFSQVFQSSKAISGNTVQQNLGFTVNSTPVSLATSSDSAGTVTFPPQTMTTALLRSHYHPASGIIATRYSPQNPFKLASGLNNQCSVSVLATGTSIVGQSQSHSHSNLIINHNHTFQPATHTHPITSSQTQHAHPITGSENFNILYVDVVVATKN